MLIFKTEQRNKIEVVFLHLKKLPRISPNIPPKLQKIIECHSNCIFIHKILKEAQTIPKQKIRSFDKEERTQTYISSENIPVFIVKYKKIIKIIKSIVKLLNVIICTLD